MKSAVTISLVAEAAGGPFVFWDNLAEGCAHASRLGFDAVEIFPSSPAVLRVAEVKQLMIQYRLEVAAVGSGAGWVKHKLRLTDPDTGARRRAREFIEQIIDLAGQLDAPAIVGSMQGRCEPEVSRPQALQWLGEALEELGERAARFEMPLLYEPLNRYETDLFNRQGDAAAFLGLLRVQNVKLLCDLFHMNLEERSPAEALRQVGDRVGHIHFVDSNRRAIGLGHTDMKPIMAALREIDYTGYLSAEVLPLPDSLTAAQQSIESFRRWTQEPSHA